MQDEDVKNEPEITDLDADEEAELFGADPAGARGAKTVSDVMNEKARGGDVEGLPEWASIPAGFEIRPGTQCVWLRFKAEWTRTPEKGDRWCLLTPLTVAEERTAYKKSAGDQQRAIEELTKATLRLIDGARADRSGSSTAGAVHIFWADIGTKCRQMVMNFYVKTHTLNAEERADFFENCVAVTTAVAV